MMSDLGYEYVWAVSKMGGWIVGTVQPRLSGPRLSGPLIIRTSWRPENTLPRMRRRHSQ